MKKLLEQKREEALACIPADQLELLKVVNGLFNALEDEADRFVRALRHDAIKLERTAARLPHSGKLLLTFASALRDYAHRVEQGSSEAAPGLNGEKIIVLGQGGDTG